MKNTFGNALSVTLFGESHGAAIGAVISVTIIFLVSSIINILVKYVGPIAPNTFNETLVSESIVLRALDDSGIMSLVEKLIQK